MENVHMIPQKPRSHLPCWISCSAALPLLSGQLRGTHRELQELAMAALDAPAWKVWFTVTILIAFPVCVILTEL